ncbi:MAG: plastocyanin/DNA/RNA endonuclease YhcR with UshA esterase domain [Saprospiraceae bacterium]|jgi:plastocyanin/DNA/RNA endonuclease YhcR with UshA esterase domain
MKRIYLTLLALCLCVSAVFAQTTVTVQSNTFTPQNITINVGETVTFDNVGGFHNVNGTQTSFPSNPESFGNGGAASAPWDFQHTFSLAGTYDYQCDPHAGLGMTGTITVVGGATDDVVISEIMYNPPESGTDSLEYIEIYNNGADAVDLEGWSLSGATFTFPAVTINAGEYLVTCVNSTAMATVLGVNTDLQWTGGGLSNGGETLQLINAGGTIIDEVNYDDGGDWPTSPDGNGNSLVLCDPNSDNSLGSNWIAALTSTGAFINDAEIFANPGAASGCPDNPVVAFLDTETTVSEDAGTLTARVAINFGNANATSVDVVISTASTATPGDDFDFTTVTLTFPAGLEKDTMEVTMDITDDIMPEGTEIAALALVSPTNEAIIDPASLNYLVNIEDNDTETEYDVVTIGVATETDVDGVGTMVDSLVQIQGVVYGVNMRPAGLQFTIIDDNNDGIGLFFNAGDLAYTVTEGDEIIIQGTVGQFNGLLQIAPDAISLVDAGNTLFAPTVITEYTEAMESQLVRIEDVMLVDANDWTNAGSGFNVDVTDGTNTYVVRIDADITLYGMAAPTGTFSVTGIGGQFDNSSPFDAGYQLLPRYVADIDPYNEMPPVEPTYPAYDIAEVTGQNADGVADSLNTTCTLTGVVQSIDYRGGDGVQFFMNDGTDGIAVFSNEIAYYDVTMGDEVTMEGSIGQFNGLTQVYPDTIILNSAANAVEAIQDVPGLGESTESEYIILSITFNDPTQWVPDGSGFNMDATVDGTGDQITIRIDNDSDLFSNPSFPYFSDSGSALGFGSQFDFDAPYFEGYQLLLTDFNFLDVNDPSLSEKISLFPNPAQDILNVVTEDVVLDNIRITNMLGQTVLDINSPSNRLNISNLPAGIYTVTFTTEDRFYSEQLIKK